MMKNCNSLDLWQMIDRKKFDALVLKWEADKWVRSFKTWEFTCALITMITTKLESYREVESTLGIARSTFGDAMEHRSHGFFEELCDLILLQIRTQTTDRKVKGAIREILAIDSTECRVHGSLFSKVGWNLPRAARKNQAGAKLHIVCNVDNKLIEENIVTGVRRNDSPVSLQLKLASNKTYVFDRAYCDLAFWMKITKNKSHFVTRMKGHIIPFLKDSNFSKLSRGTRDGVIFDGIYRPNQSAFCSAKVPTNIRPKVKFRYVVYRDAVTKKIFYFVTSDFKSKAQVIAGIYKKRWAVELLFRWLKGHFDIRRIGARTINSARIRFAATIVTQLLLQLRKIAYGIRGSLWGLLREIRTQLVMKSLIGKGNNSNCRWKSAPINGFRKHVF